MIRAAVGFDFDHTLGTDDHLERRALAILAEILGAELAADDPGVALRLEALLAPFRMAEESMSEMLLRFVGMLQKPRPLGGEELARVYREICYSLVDDLVRPIAGALACVADLAGNGVPVGILTNGWSELQERKIACALGDFPGPVLVSERIGAYKPSALAFSKLENALGVSPAQLWYVGDNPAADIAGARAYGLRAVWLKSNGTAYPADLAPPTAAIERLEDLAAIVRGT